MEKRHCHFNPALESSGRGRILLCADAASAAAKPGLRPAEQHARKVTVGGAFRVPQSACGQLPGRKRAISKILKNKDYPVFIPPFISVHYGLNGRDERKNKIADMCKRKGDSPSTERQHPSGNHDAS